MIPTTLLLLGLTALVAPSMSYSCYGDISALQAPAISCRAVRAPDCGLATVRRIAEADVVRLRKYEIPIKRVARNLCLDPALIAAIISQESRVGLLLDNGWDQERQKYGLMQLGRQQHVPFGVWDSEEHINQCSTILVLAINEVRARHPTWTWDQQLRAGICTYSAKMGNLQVYEEDPCNRDDYYVNSVIRRAQYFKRHGF
ncbi:lysozyme g-like [Cariama cristata]|uniref:lysozyme g-like n=1 Tax=Cariama cristata TaxID=54380 RepID=UPI000520A35D|nr:PREDICTED: lysozyme g-like [Cariama cristata]